MRRTIRTVLVSVFLGTLAAPAAADSKVRGKVVDSKGGGIAGARVSLNDPRTGRSYGLSAGKDGGFYQRGVQPGTYTLKVEHEGYTAHIVEEVMVQAGVERSFDITLRSIAEREAELRKEQGLDGYGEGYEAFQKGDFDTALRKADEAIAAKPDDAKGYDMKAKALVSLKRYAEAIPLLEKELGMTGAAADVKQVLAGTTYNAGVVASREDRMDEALGYWEKAIELGNEDPQLDNVLGRAYLAKQEFAKARQHLEAYVTKIPAAKDADEVKLLLGEIRKLEAKP